MADPGESQASENQAQVNLVELFLAGETGIERRRTENLFKQLDERQLTDDEQAIIQQRVELQRKMFQEYERREKQRKLRELQEVCPDLDEDAAQRALELCNWKEEVAAERVSSDPAFVRRVCSGAAAVEHAPAPKSERQRSNGSRAAVGPRPRLVDPSQVGAVFVGRFKSRLGPHQISAMGRQQQHPQPAAAAAAPRAAGASHQAAGRRGGAAAAAVAGAEAAAGSSAPASGAAGSGEAHLEEDVAVTEAADVGEQAQQHAGDAGELSHGGDVEMVDAGRMVEPDSVELGPHGDDGAGVADVARPETEDEEDVEVEDPNSADLSDNELQYEESVLPVMSPLAGKRHQQHDHRQTEQEENEDGAAHQGNGAGPTNAAGVQPPQDAAERQDQGGQLQPAVAAAQQPVSRDRSGARNLAGALVDEDEVSSPARGREQHQQHQSATTTTAAATAGPSTDMPAAGPGTAVAAPAARPRRATAELAAALRHVDESDEARSGAETATDGADSDFEVGSAGRGGRGGHASTSSGSEVEVEEEDSDDFVAPGSRKRRAGGAGGKRQQQSRKRAASGGSAAARNTRQRAAGGAAQRRVADVPTAAPGAIALAVAMAGAASADAPDMAGPSGAVATEPAVASGSGAAGAGPSNTALHPAASVPAQGAAAVAAPSGRGGGHCEDDSEATVTEDESPGGRAKRPAKGSKKGKGGGKGGKAGAGGGAGLTAGGAGGGGAAISASGHTCRGRVKQKGVKRADLLAVGTLIARPGWFNAGYIFPAGFRAQTLFRSSVDLDSLTLHTCEILGESGQYWPAPTFVVTAADRPDEPLVAKSCTGCWTAVLRRINGEIEGRRAAGEDLPPPPKTAIAGPEYFGLNQPEICAAIEALDSERKCTTYWDGKMDREAAREGQPVPSRGGGGGRGASGGSTGGAAAAAGSAGAAAAARPPRGTGRSTSNGGGGAKGRRGGRRASGADEDEEPGARNEGEEDPEETYAGNRWSAVTRAERYRKRCEDAGEDAAALLEQSLRDNPLPGFLDPITLEPVVNPAISPYGHVMGLATWKAVLAEHGRCPFTKQPLKPEALTVLTKNNIERYRSRIIQQ